jgi:hypothetical protein
MQGDQGEDGDYFMIPGPRGATGAPGAGGSGTQGTTTVDLGAYPGVGSVKKSVADAGVGPTSIARAWIAPAATADHSADEHTLERLQVTAIAVNGVGVDIYLTDLNLAPAHAYGVWNVGWSYA